MGLKGRGELVAPGVWRLQLPLPWGGIPHVNSWALETVDGVVLVDCGVHAPGSFDALERALGMAGAGLEDIHLLICTHAHPDHYGQAALIVERAGCPLWMHPRHAHATAAVSDPQTAVRLRRAAARRSGVPEAHLPEDAGRETQAIAGAVQPDADLVDGVVVASTAGRWQVVETPGHAPSHVCLFQADARLLISGDHVLERHALHFDVGYTPNPVGEYLGSLTAVDALGAERCLPGHGKPFGAVGERIAASRHEVSRRLGETAAIVASSRVPMTAFEVASRRFDARLLGADGALHLGETLALLHHLERQARVVRDRAADVDRWVATNSNS